MNGIYKVTCRKTWAITDDEEWPKRTTGTVVVGSSEDLAKLVASDSEKSVLEGSTIRFEVEFIPFAEVK